MIHISTMSSCSMISVLLTIAVFECQLFGADAINLKKAFPWLERRLARVRSGRRPGAHGVQSGAREMDVEQVKRSFSRFETFMRTEFRGTLGSMILDGNPVNEQLELVFTSRSLEEAVRDLIDEDVARHCTNIRRYLTFGNGNFLSKMINFDNIKSNIKELDEEVNRLNRLNSLDRYDDIIDIYKRIKTELQSFDAALKIYIGRREYSMSDRESQSLIEAKSTLDDAAYKCINKQAGIRAYLVRSSMELEQRQTQTASEAMPSEQERATDQVVQLRVNTNQAQDEGRTAMERANPVSRQSALVKQAEAAPEDDFKFNAPESLKCPISLELMRDPVVTSDGHTYERATINQWLEEHATSPLTGLLLKRKELIPNVALKNVIDELRESQRLQRERASTESDE